MSRFARRDGEAPEEREEPDAPGVLDDPGIPDEVRRLVRGRAAAHPHLVRKRGAHPARLLAALPEALLHVEFTPAVQAGRSLDWSADFVPWTALESIRVTGGTLRFAWTGRAVSCDLASPVEALQLARSFLGQAAPTR